MGKGDTLLQTIPLQDASEQAAAQDWPELTITQISAGSYEGQIRVIEHPDVNVYLEHQNRTVHKCGVTDKNLCTVSFLRVHEPQARFSEYNSANNSLFFLPCSTEFDIFLPGEISTVYFRFDQSRLLDKARALNPARWETPPTELQIMNTIDRRALDALANDLDQLAPHAAPSTLLAEAGLLANVITDQVVTALNSSWPGSAQTQPEYSVRRRARQTMNRVLDYLTSEVNQVRCPTITDICYSLQISERAIQYAFKEVLNLSPNTYLRFHRLNRAHAQLRRPASAEVSVTAVATHWNFWHLGRFSSDYLRLFGELPSTTLRRALN
jgi:AraC family transcriptional regulator, ethanolamine operon transcriptional activator